MRTRVGYAGGSQADPTYHNLGDYTETLEMDFNPEEITYRELLEIFFNEHNPAARLPVQYTSIIFYHDETQAVLAREAMEKERARFGQIFTRLEPIDVFYRAEDYHQKYYLQRYGQLTKDLLSRYTDFGSFVDSTAAARINGYVAGYGSMPQLMAEIDTFGLTAAEKQLLLDIVSSIWSRK